MMQGKRRIPGGEFGTDPGTKEGEEAAGRGDPGGTLRRGYVASRDLVLAQ